MMKVLRKGVSVLSIIGVLLLGVAPFPTNADESLTVSVTPPLFQLTIGPGEFWASDLKIVNSNSFDATYYATVVNFEGQGESGTGIFQPVIEDFGNESLNTHSLARWINITREPIVVGEGQSLKVPFTVEIPENAEPGGHYAAILVGTQPPTFDEQNGPTVAVSSFVSSLFFVRIKGDVVEEGRIREFIPEKGVYERPEAQFVLRFENTGTVHVQPQGTITIYNMWGKKRGEVAINQKTTLGNVLPQTTRRFEFMWSGEFSPLDLGRYSAVATLTYGDEVKRNVSATTYFWVVPIIPVVATLGTFLVIVFGIAFLIRRYIKKVLTLEQSLSRDEGAEEDIVPEQETHLSLKTFARPIQEGVVDLRNITLHKDSSEEEKMSVRIGDIQQGMHTSSPVVAENKRQENTFSVPKITINEFLVKYRMFFVFIVFLAFSSAAFAWYFGEALVPGRTFEISNVTVEEEAMSDVEKDSE